MKCRFEFSVRSRIRPTALLPIRLGEFTYTFFAESGFIDRVSVVVPADPEMEASELDVESKTNRLKGINVKTPDTDTLLHTLRVTEGLLALYGMIGIDFEHMEME